MPTIGEIISGRVRQTLSGLAKSNFARLYGRGYKPDEDVWQPSFGGLTHVEVGVRLTVPVAEDLGLQLDDVRTWPDGRRFLAVPLGIAKDGTVQVPASLLFRDDWFVMLKVVTCTAFDKKQNRPFYACCLSPDGRKLYAIDASRTAGVRTHSVAYYKTYAQMCQCTAGTESKPVPVRPMNLIHILKAKDNDRLFRVVIQRLMVLRRKDARGWSYRLQLTPLKSFSVQEKGHDDQHGPRLFPADIARGLTGEFSWIATAVRDTYRVLNGDPLPVFADRFDPVVERLIGAIWQGG